MKIQAINTYTSIQKKQLHEPRRNVNFAENNVNFGSLNASQVDPALKFFNNYFSRVAKLSKCSWLPIEKKIEPFLKQVNIKNKDNQNILLWDINKEEKQKYVIVLHGLGHNISRLQQLYTKILENTDYAVLALEYHESEIKNTSGLSKKPKEYIYDAEASLQYLQENGVKTENIRVLGHSFGGFVATQLAAKYDELGGLIVVSPVNTGAYILQEMDNNHINKMSKITKIMSKYNLPVRLCLQKVFNINKTLKHIKTSIDIVYSEDDSLISSAKIPTLYHDCPKAKIITLQNGGHIFEKSKIDAVVELLKDS